MPWTAESWPFWTSKEERDKAIEEEKRRDSYMTPIAFGILLAVIYFVIFNC